VLIQLDRRDPGSGRTGLGDLVIAATGGRLGAPRRIDDGARTNLVLPVTEATGELRLAVASVADWWLAGVTGTGGDPDELIGVVTADPHVRLAAAVAAPVPAVAPVEVRLRIDPNGDRP